MQHKFIVIEGNIGAGKTSLSKKIAEQYNAKLILEQFADNPFLPKFYQNPEKYSFQLELSFLAERYQQLVSELNNLDLFKPFFLSDYYFTKSLIFASSTLHDEEFILYRKIFNIIYTSLPKPDLYIFLNPGIDKLLNNIKKRGRNYEQSITRNYLLRIQESYFTYFKQQKDISFLILDTSNIDFVNNPNDYELVLEKIFNNRYPVGINSQILKSL